MNPIGKFAVVATLGTVPSLAVLKATSGDRELLGKGHEFWSGAVWGVAGASVAKMGVDMVQAGGARGALSAMQKGGPFALGWIASDFIALGIDAATRGDRPSGAH